MNNLISNYLVFFSLMMLVLQGCSSNKITQNIVSCFVDKTQISVVRVDEKNNRFFAVATDPQLLHERLRSSSECFSNSAWSNDWRISVFSSSQYAGYKDETEIIPLHKNNSWAKAYIAEYIGPEDKFISMPAIQP